MNWRTRWITCVYEFGNPLLQRMSWIDGPTADWPGGKVWVSSFIECNCTYFDDLLMGKGIEPFVEWSYVAENEATAGRRFHETSGSYDPPIRKGNTALSDAALIVQQMNESEERDPVRSRAATPDVAAILRDPEWQRVVFEATSLWSLLKRTTTDPEERSAMAELEERFGVIGLGPPDN